MQNKNTAASAGSTGGPRSTSRHNSMVEEHPPAPVSHENIILNVASEASMFNLIYASVIASLGILLSGFDFSISGWLPLIIASFSSTTVSTDYNYYDLVESNQFLKGFLIASSVLGIAFTYSILLFFANHLPKRTEMIISSVMYIIGISLQLYSTHIDWASSDGNGWLGLLTLILGRLFFGAGVATSFHSAPQYISELCPDSLRGNVGSLVEASLATGLLICNFIAYAFISVDDGSAQLAAGWRAFYYGAYVVAIVYLVAVANNLPKTPFNMFKYGWIGLDGSRKKYPDAQLLESIRFVYPLAQLKDVEEFRRKFRDDAKITKRWKKIYRLENENDDSDVCKEEDEYAGESGESADSGDGVGGGQEPSQHDAAATAATTAAAAADPTADPSFPLGNGGVPSALDNAIPPSSSISPVSASTSSRTFSEKIFGSVSIEVKILFGDVVMRRLLFVAIGFEISSVLCGHAAFICLAQTIFDALLPGHVGAWAVGLALSKVVTSYALVVFGERMGRRDFLQIGQYVMLVGQAGAVLFLYNDLLVAAASFMLVTCVGFEMSYGTLSWVIVNEMFPHFVRSAANSVIVSCFFVAVFIAVWLSAPLYYAVGITDYWGFFLVLTLTGIYFTNKFVPELKGNDMEKNYRLVNQKYLEYMPTFLSGVVEGQEGPKSLFDEYDTSQTSDVLDGLNQPSLSLDEAYFTDWFSSSRR